MVKDAGSPPAPRLNRIEIPLARKIVTSGTKEQQLFFEGQGSRILLQVRDDKIHENELLSDTVELALTYKDNIERGPGECVISSK